MIKSRYYIPRGKIILGRALTLMIKARRGSGPDREWPVTDFERQEENSDLRIALAEGELEAAFINYDGDECVVPRKYWRSVNCLTAFRMGSPMLFDPTPSQLFGSGQTDKGMFVLDQVAFAGWLYRILTEQKPLGTQATVVSVGNPAGTYALNDRMQDCMRSATGLEVSAANASTLTESGSGSPVRRRPGRPTPSAILHKELRRRAVAGEMALTLVAEAQYLSEWLSIDHPREKQSKPKSIENTVRKTYWQLRDGVGAQLERDGLV